MEYFERMFSWAWYQRKLNAQDGHDYLTAAMRLNDTRMLRFLLDKGAQLRLVPTELPDNNGNRRVDFDDFDQVLSFPALPSAEMVDLLLQRTQDSQTLTFLTAWMAYWAIKNHDHNMLRRTQQAGLELFFNPALMETQPFKSYLPTLFQTALSSGNFTALEMMGYLPEQSAQLKAYLPAVFSSSSQLGHKGLDRRMLELFCSFYSDCQDRSANGEWTRSRQQLLRFASGSNPDKIAYPDAMRYLLANGADMRTRQEGAPFLELLAAKNATLSLVQEVQKAGADLQQPGVLKQALTGGNVEVINWLLDQGVNPDTGLSAAETRNAQFDALEAGIKAGNRQIVERLLQLSDTSQLPASLMKAAYNSEKTEFIQILNRYRVPMPEDLASAIGQNPNSVMFKALFEGSQDPTVLKQLFNDAMDALLSQSLVPKPEAGNPLVSVPVDPDYSHKFQTYEKKRQSFMIQALDLAFHKPETQPQAWSMLPFALQISTGPDKARIRQWLFEGLKRGLDPNAQSVLKWPLLHHLIQAGEFELVRRFVAAGADLEQKNTENATALQIAAGTAHLEIFQFLLEKGSSLQAIGTIDTFYYVPLPSTPLSQALRREHVDQDEIILQTLLSLSDLSKEENKWLLFPAVASGHFEVVKQLARHHDLRLTNTNGENLIFMVNPRHASTLLPYLVRQGLDINAVNFQDETALYRSLRRGAFNPSVTHSLLDNGANPCIRKKSGSGILDDILVNGKINPIRESSALQRIELLIKNCSPVSR